MTENEFLLMDRLGVIKDTIKKYGEENFYLSFSGGKDSLVVHHLLDMALPNNKIPRVFINTGIEYIYIYQFVKEFVERDPRFQIIAPMKNIKATLEQVGYPFKSKEHSLKLHEWQKGNRDTKMMYKYLEGDGSFSCPDKLKYQFSDDFKMKVSQFCCIEMKKKPIKKWMKENNRHITITGMMRDEGGERTTLNCIVTRANGEVTRFHPLAKVTHEWEKWFIEEYNIKLCKLYYEPFNYKRVGCKGCPFNLHLEEDLSIMQKYLPNERKQCEIIWKPVYDEYRRLGYRLKKEEQTKLF